MGYELMQILQGDAGESFHSLDDIYYFGGQHGKFSLLFYLKDVDYLLQNALFIIFNLTNLRFSPRGRSG